MVASDLGRRYSHEPLYDQLYEAADRISSAMGTSDVPAQLSIARIAVLHKTVP